MMAISTTKFFLKIICGIYGKTDCQPEIIEKCFFCFNGEYTLIPKNNSVYCGS